MREERDSVIYDRFIKYYNNSDPSPKQILSTPDSVLKTKIGLSSKKVEYVKNLSSKVMDKKLNLSSLNELTDEEIITQLVQVKGIGRWTANVFDILSWKTRYPTSYKSWYKEGYAENILSF